jgi:uncharacterized protein YqiB (DUF1249 family)
MIADGSIALPRPTRPGSFTALMSLYESNYLRLHWLLDDVGALAEAQCSRVAADLPLHLSVVERSPYTTTLRMTYFFEDAHERVADPDLTIRVYRDAGLAEAMACRSRHLHRALRRFHTAPGDELSRRWNRNSMLNKWLEYCHDQGHRFHGKPSCAAGACLPGVPDDAGL